MENKKLVNMTPHDITLLDERGKVLMNLKSCGSIRLSQTITLVGVYKAFGFEIPITHLDYADAVLPPKKDNTFYVVSKPTAEYAKRMGRDDFFIPGIVVKRDGKVIGMRSLGML